MATISEPASNQISRRQISVPRNFERTAFLFMRLSGFALIILAVGHMLIQHVLNSSTNLTIQFVALQWSSWGWKVYDMLLLVLAIPHGVNGLRNVIADYVHNDSAVKWINRLLALFIIATVVWAAYAIANFDGTMFLPALEQ